MKVIKKQTNSKMCLICGMENQAGVNAPFYEMEDESVMSIFKFKNEHQSYPGRTHGGMISTMLDELVGRAIWIYDPTIWGVTMDINVKFRKPVPLETTLIAKGKITKNTSMFFSGEGYIYDVYGKVLAEAKVNYIKLPIAKIAENAKHEDIDILIPDDVTEINFKER